MGFLRMYMPRTASPNFRNHEGYEGQKNEKTN